MNKLKLTLSILALTVSQIASAEYIVKVPLEVANGGSLPNGSITFKNNAVEPVLPPVVDCVEVGVSTDCDERLGAWELFADNNGLSNNWNILLWSNRELTNIPIEPYPTTHVDVLELFNDQLTNVDGLSNITSAGRIDLGYNRLENVNGLSNLKSAEMISLEGNKLTDINGLLGLTSIGNLYLGNNQLKSIDELSNITNAETISLRQNNLENVEGLANIAISYEISIDSSYSGPKLKANSRFCSLTPMDRFTAPYGSYAIKSQVCETP